MRDGKRQRVSDRQREIETNWQTNRDKVTKKEGQTDIKTERERERERVREGEFLDFLLIR